MSEPAQEAVLLEVLDLVKHYPVTAGVFSREVGRVRAVDGVSFEIREGETLGLVGESGCGKTTVGRTLLRLEEPTSGRVRVRGVELGELGSAELREMRRSLQMVFQDPMSSLNPRMTVRDIVGEPLAVHGLAKGEALDERVIELLEKVGIPGPWRNRYPHEFSGGQRQRIGVARALALGPRLIVCDEAVSALDVSVQAQVLNLLIDLREELGLSYLFISHDLSVVRHISDRIAVMYLGQIVELATTKQLFEGAAHPYTRALLSAIPVPDPTRSVERIVLEGDVPSPIAPPPGCRFHTRCPAAMDRCRQDEPPAVQLEDDHVVRCFLVEPGSSREAVEQRRHDAEEARRAARAQAEEDVDEVARSALPEEPEDDPVRVRVAGLATAAALVVMLLALLVSLWPGSRAAQAERQLDALAAEIEGHRAASGEWPERLDSLGWRLHDVFDDGRPLDPWGQLWQYGPTAEGFLLRSLGPDAEPGGGDDLVLERGRPAAEQAG